VNARRTFFRSFGLCAAVPAVALAKAVGLRDKQPFDPIKSSEPISTTTFNKRFEALHLRIDEL
jgi:hypothetical protein